MMNWLKNITFFKWNKKSIKSLQDLLYVIAQAETKRITSSNISRILKGVIAISNLKVRDVMISRANMKVIDEDETYDSILSIIKDSRHSRYPVISKNKDHILGILLTKDLIGCNKKVKIQDIMRPAMLTPEGKRIDNLLHDFQERRNHMSIVVNEYGEVSGLITLENIFEEIFGEIDDEHDAEYDKSATVIKVLSPGCYIVSGLTPIDAFNEFFSVEYSNEYLDTFSGLLTQRLGRIPEVDESFNFDQFKVKILSADSRRIKKVEVSIDESRKK